MSSAEAIKLSISLLLRERAFVAHLRLWTKRGEGTREENVSFLSQERNKEPMCDEKATGFKLGVALATCVPPWQGKFSCPDRRKRHPSP